MKNAPLIVGGGLIFWSWQTGHWLIGLALACLLEAARLTSLRWELSNRDFNRIVDVSVLAFLATTSYFINNERSFEAFVGILIWLPVSFSLLPASQRYSHASSLPLTALFLSLRWLEAKRVRGSSDKRVDLTFPYFCLCLLSASAANQRTVWFFPALFALAAGALWLHRSRRFRPHTWLATLAAAGALGYAVMTGLYAGHKQAQDVFLQWFKDYRENRTDPYRSHTALGDIGTLKLSDKILFRVSPGEERSGPILLRDASYNMYSRGYWFAVGAEFQALSSTAEVTTWELGEHAGEGLTLAISAPMNAFGEALLTLPGGAFRLEDLPVIKMQRNGLGAVRVEEGPPLIRYRVRFDPALSLDAAPSDQDLDIPAEFRELVAGIGSTLRLHERSPREAVQTIAEYFSRGFTYSLSQHPHDKETTPLANFLHNTRSGHCEFYATASVLLLRQAGIPARYATGYSAQEYSWLEDAYLVRKRHGHAWALANLDGKWTDIDNTPSVWRTLEEASAPAVQPLMDLFSWLKHRVQLWRWGTQEEETTEEYLIWLLVPLVLVLIWRLSGKRRVSASTDAPEEETGAASGTGADSPFYEVITYLNGLGLSRLPGESPRGWIKRITPALKSDITAGELREMLSAHQKYRFDPLGLSREERVRLDEGVQEWLMKRKG